jgi:2-dehydro-3-deoxyphosphogluconate aldolase / (4S)-4-hydroxy-2-oxoglutarate aldolase
LETILTSSVQERNTLKGPFPQIDFVPTGGVNLETTPEFIKAGGAAALAAGGELEDAKALREGNLEAITSNARNFVEAVRAARMAIGQRRRPAR